MCRTCSLFQLLSGSRAGAGQAERRQAGQGVLFWAAGKQSMGSMGAVGANNWRGGGFKYSKQLCIL
ncbi:UNVERIFIED_CONTAM: hypothetical protein FKN15_076973 [Acipenser sinensis]